jgi:hypothetical protein
MKNIYLIPTDNPSRLAGSEYITNEQGIDKRVFKFKLWDKLIPNKDLKDVGYIPQNIYITSDEEIKEGDWVIWIGKDNQPFLKKVIGERDDEWLLSSTYDMWVEKDKPKKIILTTDQELIKDGVQSIDDEFLEWFVKNPSCEKVEVQKWASLAECGYSYQIIIPQEEPKCLTKI